MHFCSTPGLIFQRTQLIPPNSSSTNLRRLGESGTRLHYNDAHGAQQSDVRVAKSADARDLSENLSARRETGDAELLKVGEPCEMAIPSQARLEMAGKV
jgi:hypothetical protein